MICKNEKFDVEIDNSIDISHLLNKSTFQINEYNINKIDLLSRIINLFRIPGNIRHNDKQTFNPTLW